MKAGVLAPADGPVFCGKWVVRYQGKTRFTPLYETRAEAEQAYQELKRGESKP